MKNTNDFAAEKHGTAAANEKNVDAVTMIADSAMGDIRIHDGVIATLARKAVLGVTGVSRLAGNTLVDNFAEIVGSRRIQSRAITVNVNDDNKVDIEIKINIKSDFIIPDVAENVQRAVIAKVEEVTGMTVQFVHVLIQDVDDEVEENADEDNVN